MEKLIINTPFIRLDSALKLSGIVQTGGHAKILIQDGEAYVNGEPCFQRGHKLHAGDVVECMEEQFEVEAE